MRNKKYKIKNKKHFFFLKNYYISLIYNKMTELELAPASVTAQAGGKRRSRRSSKKGGKKSKRTVKRRSTKTRKGGKRRAHSKRR
jgi:hypothetical protein